MKLQNILILGVSTILVSGFTFASPNSVSVDSALASGTHLASADATSDFSIVGNDDASAAAVKTKPAAKSSHKKTVGAADVKSPATKKKVAGKQVAAKKDNVKTPHNLSAVKTTKHQVASKNSHEQKAKAIGTAKDANHKVANHKEANNKKISKEKIDAAISKAGESIKHFAAEMKAHEHAGTTVSRVESKTAMGRMNASTQVAMRQDSSKMNGSSQVAMRQDAANVMAANR